ncbi:chaperone NapD [Ferrimonas lipolytica]|uniref:Chaperone NapD n=1 Tax=Ferrimonas lipolytica TaxID=2724191 RepID=A0A6H1UI56_9GAMM|nr:chaperone NapD [Ferrimonas lipolytica]QIZ77472.1 chaperone NapD [Ferrimonas lipolytica]
MEHEYHVVSLVVHANPDKHQLVVEQLQQLSGAELVTHTKEHKYVVVIEGSTRQQVLDGIEAVQAMNGIVSTTLAYHQVDQLDSENAA